MKHYLCFIICCAVVFAQEKPKTLAEALGYDADAKIVILNADDYGMCHAENVGTQKVLEEGIVSSVTMMMPCPWVLEAVEYIKKNNMKNVGVHVALTSEWKRYRWAPVSRSPWGGKSSLVDEKGYMWPGSLDVELNTDIEDVKAEVHAQLKKALDLGVDLSHFDSHMGSLYGVATFRVELLAAAYAYSYEFGLPFRMPFIEGMEPLREKGFAILDDLVIGAGQEPKDPKGRKQYFIDLLKNLSPGVTEIYIHPAVNGEELARVTNSAKSRQLDIDIFCDPELKQVVEEQNIKVIDFTSLRKWQREQMNWNPSFRAEDVYDEYVAILKEIFHSEKFRRSSKFKKLHDICKCE